MADDGIGSYELCRTECAGTQICMLCPVVLLLQLRILLFSEMVS